MKSPSKYLFNVVSMEKNTKKKKILYFNVFVMTQQYAVAMVVDS